MSNFSRSFKAPSYLSSQYRNRPQMGGRAYSNSPEPPYDSDGSDQATRSGRNTPQAYQSRRYPPPNYAPSGSSAGVPSGETSAPTSGRVNSPSPASHTSSPIAIELPRASRKIGSAPAYTPPAPLSARGDLPGGYFPNHEDPQSRVQRTHPFHSDTKSTRVSNTLNITQDAVGSVGSYRDQRGVPRPHTTNAMGTANAPGPSYFPSGYHDSSLPMGKYYPSNYERTHGQSRPTSGTPSSPVNMRGSGFPGSTGSQPSAPNASELQQYNRQMMAQASRAATEVMGASQTKCSPQMAGLGLNVRFAGQMMQKPHAPRLHPLGSPGPVTPMELESSGTSASGTGAGGNYLDKGRGGSRRSSHAGLAPPESSFSPRSM